MNLLPQSPVGYPCYYFSSDVNADGWTLRFAYAVPDLYDLVHEVPDFPHHNYKQLKWEVRRLLAT